MARELIYRIRNWDEHYECSDTKRIKTFSKYVPIPNRMDGSGYVRLLSQKNGPALYGAWVTLVAVASRCHVRGTLTHGDGSALDVETISLMTRIPVEVYQELIPLLLSPKIGWMEVVDETGTCVDMPSACRVHAECMQSACRVHAECTQVEEKRVEESREEDRRLNTPPSPPGGETAGRASRQGEVLKVFEHYKTYHPRSYPKPNSKSVEWRKILARLSEGFTPEDLCEAIDGCHVTPYNCGVNAQNRKFQSLELIVRDGSKVQQFMDAWHNRDGPVLTEKTQRTMSALDRYIERTSGNGTA